MRIQITLNIPSWTKWAAVSGVFGLVLGVGVDRVFADQVTVKTNWADGDTLTAADLNANFAALKTAVDRLKHPDCPEDYTKDASAPAGIVVCKQGVDEVVKVGFGGSVFWIDRYEASIWPNSDATGTQYGVSGATDYGTALPVSGDYATSEKGLATRPLYAVSVAGKQPSAFLTWFQAQAACRLSGKRLPTGEEWLAAALGTPDPGANAGSDGSCATNASGVRNTGAGTKCVSAWGAQDMIGNVWEWTSDWFAGVGDAKTTATAGLTWGTALRGDGIWNITSKVWTTDAAADALPAAAIRGGCWANGALAGRFAIALSVAPSYAADGYYGFRCVIPH